MLISFRPAQATTLALPTAFAAARRAVCAHKLRAALAAAVVLALGAAFAPVGTAGPQDKPDRPPWAQKTKAGAPKPASQPQPQPAPAPQPPADSGPGADKSVPAPPLEEEQQQSAGSQRNRLRFSVNLVTVFASVLDEKNRPAPDLPIEAFKIFEEGVQQKIEFFEAETTQPLDIALMIDSSMSTHKEFAFEQEAAAHFIRQVLRPRDGLAVYGFDESVTMLADFSDNIGSLQAAVHRIPPGAGTSIYDAVYLGSRALGRRGEDRRRVIILVTDAGETTSQSDFEKARREAVRCGALLYSIVIRPVKNEGGRNTAGEHALETITDNTGGAMLFPDSIQDLAIIFDRIDRELRTQYRLAYYPNTPGPANTYRKIEVKVLGDYVVHHRKTYLTGPQ
jgi:Ca-activated chloride channel family protein